MGEMIEGMPFADYCQHLALSSTTVSKRSRLSWAHAQTPVADKPEFVIGRAHHCRTMEPGRYAKCYAQLPGTDGIRNNDGSVSKAPEMTSAYKKRVAEFKGAHPGMDFLSPSEWNAIEKMGESARDVGGEYLSDLICEASLFFDIDGAACKSRPDGICVSKSRVVELKSTHCAEPRVFAYDVRKWGYGIQMAWQGIAVSRVLGWRPKEYIIIATESQPPYSSTIHRLSLAWIAELEEEALRYAEEYAKLPKVWPGFSRDVNVIDFSTGDES